MPLSEKYLDLLVKTDVKSLIAEMMTSASNSYYAGATGRGERSSQEYGEMRDACKDEISRRLKEKQLASTDNIVLVDNLISAKVAHIDALLTKPGPDEIEASMLVSKYYRALKKLLDNG